MVHQLAKEVITSYNMTVKLAIRRVGNSLGVLIPKATLDAWNVREGDHLELSDRAIRPTKTSGLSHHVLDELKRSIALAVVGDFTANQIRAQILANLQRWKSQGMWVSAYDEWQALAEQLSDGALFAAMLGRDETAVRLRQSMPFVGLLSQESVRALNEQAAA
jgi:Antidote-toxin recognition MazE, bacterial antitoxin